MKIPKNVFILGLVSFFNDFASEMIYPLMPLFLTTIIGVPISVVGFIEGIAEGTAAIMKFIFGYISDRMQKRKIFVVWGYTFAAVSKFLIGFAYTWPFVLFARIIDRFGKGMRTSARDSLLLQNATTTNKGYIFGVHRAMDSAGAVTGPLVALVFLYFFHDNLRLAFFAAGIPAIIGVVLLLIFVQEKKRDIQEKKQAFRFSFKHVHPSFWYFLGISMVFALGNSSDAFLLLRAKDLGLSTTAVVLAYVLYNVSQAVFSTPGGKLADKIGAKRVFTIGLGVFAIVYFLFGFVTDALWVWVLFPFYGIYIACTDGVSKAYIADFIKEDASGTYFGLYQTAIALCTFLASFIGGILWSIFGAQSTFFYGASMAFLSLLLIGYGKITSKRI